MWERPLRKADLRALGDAAPEGPILGAKVEHLGAREALLQSEPGVYFTTPHFDGHAIVLVRLGEIGAGDVPQLLVFNKLDALDEAQRPVRMGDEMEIDGVRTPRLFISARSGEGLPALRAELARRSGSVNGLGA